MMRTRRMIHLNLNQVRDFVKAASSCNFDVNVANAGRRSYIVDAKSILGVLGLDLRGNLIVSYDGDSPEFEAFLSGCTAAA